MTKPYLITFTPINRFFFGGSYSLAESFYAESLEFPQPTTVLGCIRNTILIQKGIVLPDKKNFPDIENEDAKILTGTSKISNLADEDANFGVIEKVSPVFIVKQKDEKIEDILFPAPADVIKKNSSLNTFDYVKNNAISSYSGRRVNYAVKSERKPKSSNANYFGGKDFWEAYINNKPLPYTPEYEKDKILIAHTSVGITKGKKEDAFYRKIDYSLKKYFSFGVIMWFNKENVLKEGVVVLGGEQSPFVMKISSIDNSTFASHPVMDKIIKGKCNLIENVNSCNSSTRLVALSPVVLDETQNSIITKSMEHRIVNGMHATRMINRFTAKKTESIRMIPSGSVFYCNEKVNLKTNWEIPYKIGYNYAIKIQRR